MMRGSRLETLVARTWNRIVYRWRRDQLDRELDEELAFHLEQSSASPRELGNVTLAKEECRDMWTFTTIERFFQDLRYALRMYGRTPIFTGIAILSMALGIGGNAAMFSLIDTLLVRPLPYAEPSRLVRVTGIYPRAGVEDFERSSRTMDVAGVSMGSEFNLAGQGFAARVTGSSVSPNFLSVLGLNVARGRGFKLGEEAPGRDGVVILSHSLWMSRFGGNPSALGRIIQLDGVNREIVGIMPPGFSYPSSRVQLWIPMRLDPSNFLEYWGSEFMPMIGRLRPGATLGEAGDEVRSFVARFRSKFPYPMARDFNAGATAIPLQQDIVGDVRGRLIILLCSVAAVLLIACANVAGLLLSRATTRRKELALRAALGAGRGRIIRQLLTESTGLALAGAGLGILFGVSALSIFKSVLPSTLPGLAQAGIDWQVVAAVTALALFTGLASGLAPALSASQVDVTETIKTGNQRSATGFWTRLRGLLVAAEVAVTLVLLVGAGLLLTSVYRLSVEDPGFDPAHIVTVQISPNQASCKQRQACIAFYDRLLHSAAGVEGVSETAISNSVPLDGRVPTIPVDVEGHPRTADFPSPMLWLEAVSPSYTRMLHIPLLAGRYLDETDGPDAPPVLLVPASTAKHFWPNENAIGKHLRPVGSNVWRTIVGVVGDVDHFTLRQPLPAGVAGTLYMPYAQSVATGGQIPAAMTLLAKVDSNSASASRGIEALVRDQDPSVPVGRVEPLEEQVSDSIADIRSTMLVFASFAGAAILLVAVGIYGLMSYWVSQRSYEIGLRVAVGCTWQGILSMILAHGMKLTLYGVAAGLIGALLLTRFLASLLFGVAAIDIPTFIAVTALVLGVGAIATAFPAWRATRLDPLKSLRGE
ncbi:MAG TPA: ABC transporter permease [Bryobacteraceae bacterium]|jgi:putative ABC transport system permease protein